MSTLKERILAAGMTVTEVANRARTPPAHLYNILSGVRRPRLELAEALEAACGGVIQWDEFMKTKRVVQPPPSLAKRPTEGIDGPAPLSTTDTQPGPSVLPGSPVPLAEAV